MRTNEELLAMATRFQLTDDIAVERRGDGVWAVTTSTRSCVNTYLEREFEPMPSWRDEDFIARTRFNFEDAFALADRYLAAEAAGTLPR